MRKTQAPRMGVKRRKKLILGIDRRARQSVKQCRLTRIRITDNGKGRQFIGIPDLAALAALQFDFCKLSLKSSQPVFNQALINFELGLSRPPPTNTASKARKTALFLSKSR